MLGSPVSAYRRQVVGVGVTFFITFILVAVFLALWIVYIVRSPDSVGYLSWPLWLLIFWGIFAFSMLAATVQRCVVYQSVLSSARKDVTDVTVAAQQVNQVNQYYTQSNTAYPSYNPPALPPGTYIAPESAKSAYVPYPQQEQVYEPPSDVYVYHRQPPYNPEGDQYKY
jgi:hypothetical protein